MSPFEENDTRERTRLVSAAGAASVAVAVCLLCLKAWAWLNTESVALLGTLADSLLDLLASAVTFWAVRMAAEPADREHRFGHGKLEAIAGLVQGSLILGSAAYVGYNAVLRLVDPVPVMAPEIGIGVTLVALFMTVGLVAFQKSVIRRTGSVAIRADSAHYAADVLSNLAVLAAIGLSAGFGWHLADPIFGIVVVALILLGVRRILEQSFDILLDRELSAETRTRIVDLALSHPGVLGVHDLRTRSSSTHDFIQFHLELDPGMRLADAHSVSDRVERGIRAEFPRAELIIHIDPAGIEEQRDPF